MYEYVNTNILDACKMLFGSEANINKEFLRSLKYDDLKTAFRKKAFETHPDLHRSTDAYQQRKQSDLFVGMRAAHDSILEYVEKREKPLEATCRVVNKSTDDSDRCFSGNVPPRRLQIGGYLYYRGCVPYSALIKALAWQSNQRPSIGVLAKQWRWLNDEQIRTITSFRKQPRLFGERAVHFKFLTAFQVRTLLAHQRKLQKKLGLYFVENGYLTENKVEEMVAQLTQHNAQLNMPVRQGSQSVSTTP